MLAKRIIPCLDVKDGRVVKGIQFVDLRDAGDPVEQAVRYDRERADELCFLDIAASHEGRSALLDVIRRTAESVFIPFTVGGGVRSLEDFHALLGAGADKVAVNTAALRDPDLIARAADHYGSQCVVAAVDARRAVRPAMGDQRLENSIRTTAGDTHSRDPALRTPHSAPRWEVYTHGGRTPTGIDAVEWAQRLVASGAGEVLLTSMDKDGTRDGYDLELLEAVSRAVPVPVIASGGAGNLRHLGDAIDAGAHAVLAASIFHFGEFTIGEARRYLASRGHTVRT